MAFGGDFLAICRAWWDTHESHPPVPAMCPSDQPVPLEDLKADAEKIMDLMRAMENKLSPEVAAKIGIEITSDDVARMLGVMGTHGHQFNLEDKKSGAFQGQPLGGFRVERSGESMSSMNGTYRRNYILRMILILIKH